MPHFLRFLSPLFVLLPFALAVSTVAFVPAEEGVAKYKGPAELKASRDGSKLFVMNHDAAEVQVVDTATDQVTRTIPTAKAPSGIALSTDERMLYVTCGGYRSVVQAIEVESGKVVKEVPGGHTPCGPSVSPDGKKLYVANRFNADVWELALPDLNVTRKFPVIREPRKTLVTADGKILFTTNFLPDDPNNYPDDPDAEIDVACEVCTVDLADGQAKNIRLTNGSHSLHGMAVSPDGKYLFVTQILARYQMPTSQLERGWINTNGLGIIDVEKKEWINTVLLDDIDRGAANPWGVAVSADGKRVFVAIAGTHEVCVIDVDPMLQKLRDYAEGKLPASQMNVAVPDNLAFLVGMKKRLKLSGLGPRDLIAVGNTLYVGMYYSDALQKITFSENANPRLTEVALGPKPEMDPVRRGDFHWNDATTCFQAWLSCASCHPEARTDALNWDLLNDGMGNPKNAKSLLLGLKTPPAMWHGIRKNTEYAIRTGYRHILFTEPNEDTCTDIEKFIASLEPVESPYLVDGRLSEKAERGKTVFNSEKIGCNKCHPENNYFTDQKLHDVNSRTYYDQKAVFDTPSLIEVWRTAPYMHDGRHTKMKEVFTESRHGDMYWVSEPTEQEIDDLVEYVLSL